MPEALSGRGKNGVAHGGGGYRQSGFDNAGGVFLARHDVNFRSRSLVDARHLVVVEIGLLDAAILDRDGVVQSGRKTVDGGAFDLRADAVRIDGTAAIHGINETVHLDGAVLDAGFRNGGCVGIERIKCGDTPPLALWQRLAPACFFSGELQNALEPRGVARRFFLAAELWNLAVAADELHSKRQGILARGGGKFVNTTFYDKAAAGVFDGTPPGAGHARFGEGVFDAEIRRDVRDGRAGAELTQPRI